MTGFKRLGQLVVCALLFVWIGNGCRRSTESNRASAPDAHLQTNGTLEVSAKLVEIPPGAVFNRELYDYATVLKYDVLKVHRGELHTNIIYVGQYNPFKPRAEAADGRVKNVGGTLREFRAGQVHHMALETPIEEHYMGGIVNKYFGLTAEPIYWAVWTNLE
jgi:hypothetical protein